MTTIKKILSAALCAIILAGMLVACGERGTKEIEYELNSDNASYTVREYDSLIDGPVIIPSKYRGKPVTAIGKGAFSSSDMTSVSIPDSVTTIGGAAFAHSDIEEITIPGSVKIMGGSAFYQCRSLKTLTIENGGLQSIGVSTFEKCTALTNVTLPNSLKSIEEDAFMLCESLTSITIPNGVTSIGEFAFFNCTSMTSVTIPDSVTSIGRGAFSGCPLEAIYINDLVAWCNINFEKSSPLEEAENLVVNNKPVTELVIPKEITAIGAYTFSGGKFTEVVLHDGITSIGYHAFYGCPNLTSITIPASVTEIHSNAFSECSSLTSITIPASVTSIGMYAFSSCPSLTIYFKGTVNQWNEMCYEVGDNVVYCSNGVIAEDGIITYY